MAKSDEVKRKYGELAKHMGRCDPLSLYNSYRAIREEMEKDPDSYLHELPGARVMEEHYSIEAGVFETKSNELELAVAAAG